MAVKTYVKPEITKRYNELHMYKYNPDQEIQYYANKFKNDLAPLVQNEDQRDYFLNRMMEFEKFLTQRMEKSLTMIKTPSPLITGRANYPFERKQKELNRKDNYDRETTEKITRFIQNTKKHLGSLEKPEEKAVKVYAEFRKECIRIRLIKEGKMPGYDITLFKNSLVTKLKRLFKEGHEKKELYKIFEDEGMTKIFTKRHSIYNLFQAEEKKPHYPPLTYEQCHVVADEENDRLKIIFSDDQRPDDQLKGKLKKNAFRWSPRSQAWQRKLTMNAYRAAKSIFE
ncbi:hypothetical protein [Bacillus mojavensis]|uniref:hypothetical protein n=1 Tax=Bacillus mojavensis TaxID=72360 RepID=UPI002DBF405A|nr:hypothetical protein [Bacillus mojavensis]MEC1666389.1 hypothetical protein [Bacillus mojavensis]